MTIALAIDGFFSPHTDRGISDDALALRSRITEVHRDMSETETLGKNYRETRQALISSYRECLSKDWDGYGAKAVTIADLDVASRFILTLPTSLPGPEVSVDPDGEFAFEWYNGPRNVMSLSIGRHGQISYAALFGRIRAYGTEFFSDELPTAIATNLERLFSQETTAHRSQ